MERPASSWGAKALAWGAHLFTASGAVFGFLSLLAIEARQFREGLIWMGVAYLVDAIDGSLARRARTRVVLPAFDGFVLDEIIDYFTHTLLPALFLYRAGLVPQPVAFWAASAILVLTCYHFANLNVKTDDYYFQGFPGWWNLLVFYLFLFALPPWVNFAIVLAFCVLLFVPIKYVYPSRATRLRGPLHAALAVWGIANAVILWRLPEPSPALAWLSLACVAFVGGVGILRTFRVSAPGVA